MGVVQKLSCNDSGRDFIVGDIHGRFSILEGLLTHVGFDKRKDRLIATGDLVNKGPESHRALEFLKHDWFYSVRGNHEQFILSFIDEANKCSAEYDWLYTAQQKWITHPESSTFYDVVKSALGVLPYVIEIEGQDNELPMGIVHAEVPIGMDWKNFKYKLASEADDFLRTVHPSKSVRNQALCGRSRVLRQFHNARDKNVAGVKQIFVGHTPMQSPTKVGNIVYLDACKSNGGQLNMLELGTNKIVSKKTRAPQRHLQYTG